MYPATAGELLKLTTLMKLFKGLAYTLGIAAALSAFTACDDDDDIKVDDDFKSALEQVEPDLTNVKWEKKGQWKVAECYKDRYDVDVWFDQNTRWVMTETDYNTDITAVEPAVKAAIEKSKYATYVVDDVEYYKRPDMNFYEVEMELKGQKDAYLYIKDNGEMLLETTNDIDVRPDTTF